MKTQLQELFEYESDLTNMFDSDVRVAGALLEYIRTNKKDMLEKEKELLVDFFDEGREEEYRYQHWHTLNPIDGEEFYSYKSRKK